MKTPEAISAISPPLRRGLSLEWDYLIDQPVQAISRLWAKKLGPAEALLDTLKEVGLDSVEIRGLEPKLGLEPIRRSLKILRERNLNVTVHGYVPERWPDKNNSLHDLYPWLAEWPPDQEMVMTLHAFCGASEGTLAQLSGRTTGCLGWLCEELNGEGRRFRLALELNRQKAILDPSTDVRGLVEMVQGFHTDKIGFCWDMGHGYANELHAGALRIDDKETEFLSRVVHTHIHGLVPTTKKTHDFLTRGDLPFEEYASVLRQHAYSGVWNLEIKLSAELSESEALACLIEDLATLAGGKSDT